MEKNEVQSTAQPKTYVVALKDCQNIKRSEVTEELARQKRYERTTDKQKLEEKRRRQILEMTKNTVIVPIARKEEDKEKGNRNKDNTVREKNPTLLQKMQTKRKDWRP